MEIKVIGNITEEEKEKCIREIKAKNPGKEITSLEIEANGEYLDCHYHFREADFERHHRISRRHPRPLQQRQEGRGQRQGEAQPLFRRFTTCLGPRMNLKKVG